jgi:NAD(P)-dependent dehydrogenase (short-subunit alcohol dehydrogenase family)
MTSDELPLAGKVVAVTGASRGIGRATACTLAAAGARVALLARPSDHLEAAAADVAGGLAVPIELSDSDQVRAGFATIRDTFGRLDVLVNNAATAIASRIEDVSDADLATQIGTNFLGAVYSTRSAIPMLRETQGTIVTISSESALDPFPYLLVYSAMKAALESFTRGLLHELRKDGIRVTLLIAGLTNTGGFSARWDPEVRAAASAEWEEGGYLTRVAGTKPQEPEDVAEAILFVVTRPRRTMIDVIWSRAPQ